MRVTDSFWFGGAGEMVAGGIDGSLFVGENVATLVIGEVEKERKAAA